MCRLFRAGIYLRNHIATLNFNVVFPLPICFMRNYGMVFPEIDFINASKTKVRVLSFLSPWRGKHKERTILRLLAKYIVTNHDGILEQPRRKKKWLHKLVEKAYLQKK